MHAGHAEALTVLLDHPPPQHVRILGHNHSLIGHQLCDEGGLSTRRRAKIQDRFAGLRREEAHREQRARILDIKEALLKARHGVDRWMGVQYEHEVARDPVELTWNETDSFRLPSGRELFGSS